MSGLNERRKFKLLPVTFLFVLLICWFYFLLEEEEE